MLKNTLLTSSLCLLLIACGPGSDDGDGGPDLSFESAQTRAQLLGGHLLDEVDAVQAEIQTALEQEIPADQAVASALTEVFGEEVSVRVLENGDLVFDDSFTITPEASEGNPGTVYSSDGRASLLIWSLTGDTGFFYEPTIWDMRTGDLYQGKFLGAEDEIGWRFYGPWSPPITARVTGHFDADQRMELYNAMRAGLFPDAG